MNAGPVNSPFWVRQRQLNRLVAPMEERIVAVKQDGSVLIAGKKNWLLECPVPIRAVSAGMRHIACLREDGRVMASGSNTSGQCKVDFWKDIVSVTCGSFHTVGLRADGRVVISGDSNKADPRPWRDVVDIAAGGAGGTMALLADGSVRVSGSCDSYTERVATNWPDVRSMGVNVRIYGAQADGTVKMDGRGSEDYIEELSSWRDIVTLSVSSRCVAGLTKDGTVIYYNAFVRHVPETWTDIIAVYAADAYLLGLRADGTLVSTLLDYGGPNAQRMLDETRGWNLFAP